MGGWEGQHQILLTVSSTLPTPWRTGLSTLSHGLSFRPLRTHADSLGATALTSCVVRPEGFRVVQMPSQALSHVMITQCEVRHFHLEEEARSSASK